jgi:hypothetical protein
MTAVPGHGKLGWCLPKTATGAQPTPSQQDTSSNEL